MRMYSPDNPGEGAAVVTVKVTDTYQGMHL